MSRRRTLWSSMAIVAAAAVVAAALSGCGETALGPSGGGGGGATGGGYDAPPVLKLNDDGSASFVSMPHALLGPSPYTFGTDPVFDPSRRLSVTTTIDGAVGGRLVCGRYVLTFPAGVFEGRGSVTMTLPDSTLMLCDLDVSPESLNGFLKPVDLALHTTGTDAELDSLQVYWWDPVASDWVDMGCEKTTTLERVLSVESELLGTTSGIRLDLNHFSRYATGKAGW